MSSSAYIYLSRSAASLFVSTRFSASNVAILSPCFIFGGENVTIPFFSNPSLVVFAIAIGHSVMLSFCLLLIARV
jgi:hypothetical protein